MKKIVVNKKNEIKLDCATYIVERQMTGGQSLADLITYHVLEKFKKQ